jgi:hypothetical protein
VNIRVDKDHWVKLNVKGMKCKGMNRIVLTECMVQWRCFMNTV